MKAKERHEIKTDRFLETAASVQEFLFRHGRTILFGLGAIVIIVAGWFGTSWYLDSQEASAAAEANEAIESYLKSSDAFTALAFPQSGDAEEPAKRLAQTETALKDVIKKHGGTAGAVGARFHLGLLKASKKEFEPAKKEFQTIIDSRHPFYWEMASAQLGEILERQGNYKEACEAYRRVADSQPTELPIAYFAWKTGICLEKQGNKSEASRYFAKARDSGTLGLHSSISLEIEKKIKEMSVEKPDAD